MINPKKYSIQIILLLFSIYIKAQAPAAITKGSLDDPYTVTGTETLIATQSIILAPNTWIKAGSTFIAKISPDDYSPFILSNENFVFTRKFQKALTTSSNITDNSDVIDNIIYYDGLGRAVQNISIKGTPNKKDIIIPIVYDNLGRNEKEYLPYTDTNDMVGTYRNTQDAIIAANNYYKVNFATDINVSAPNPFSQKKFEESPLNRVLQQGAPGKNWALGSGHEIKLEYQTNIDQDAVKYFIVSVSLNNEGIYFPTITTTRNYAIGQLYKTVTKNENWINGSKNNTTEEFNNKEGKIILKRSYANYDNLGQTEVKHDTYYIYDSFGNLSYVLPPKAEGNFTEAVLKDLCYQYRYDSRNRLVEKKLPGKEWESIVYDKLDRPVLTQDANLKANNKWIFTKYDAFSRPVYTGEYKNDIQNSRVTVQNLANNSTLFESKLASPVNIGGTNVNYTNNTFPNTAIDVFTISYYDGYNFDLDGAVPIVSHSANNKGLVTGSKVRILGTTNWTTNVNYYDAKGRLIYNYIKNNYLGTVSTTKNVLDFVGKALETTITHKKGPAAEITIVDVFTYDHMGRMLTQKQKINNQTQETIADNSYDKLGQLTTRGVGGSGASRLQTINYYNNIRGWLKNINDVDAIGTDLFAFGINYDTPTTGNGVFNGNISQTLWKTANSDKTLKSYVYSYDALNRLTFATDNLGRYNENLTYDKNGNVMNLFRNGNTIPGTGNFGGIDNLVYSYDAGNRLQKVEDTSVGPGKVEGFKDGASIPIEYDYDSNGNMITDANKGISAISYNYLNLPIQVTLAGGNINYVYDATGAKQRKIVGTITTDYANGFQYENNVLQFFPHPEGYVNNNSGTYEYVYQYKDHLGNVRLSYDKNLSIIEENNYYPFGLKQSEGNAVNSLGNAAAKKYKYNGKELQDENIGGFALNLYDYGARNYDPALGRWMNIDNMAEKYYDLSPYNYTINNPVNVIDPDGNDIYLLIWFSKNNETGHAGIAVDNYKTVNKKDANGDNILDKNGKVVTEQVKDGTYTYFDLWPNDAVGNTELQDNVGADYTKGIKINNLKDLTSKDPTGSRNGNVSAEGRAADGIVQIPSAYNQDEAAKGVAEKDIKNNKDYNGCNNNCSTYAQRIINSVYPSLNASQTIKPSGFLRTIYNDSKTVAPNNLYNAALRIKGATNLKGPISVTAKPYLEYFGKSNRP